MGQLVLLLALVLGISSSAWGCAQIRSSDTSGINVMESDGFIEVCAMFTEPAAIAGVLNFSTSMSGAAETPDDYIAVTMNFNVTVNMTDDLCVNITILGDNIFEDAELFLVDVMSATVELCDSSFAFVHIMDSTRLDVTFSQPIYISTDEGGLMDVCINRVENPSPFTFLRDVEYTLIVISGMGTATNNIDFSFTPPQESFNARDDFQFCGQVAISDDTIVEDDETFLVTLMSSDTIALVGDAALVIITDDDGASLSFVETSASVTEGNAGSTAVDFCIQLDSDNVLARDVNAIVNTMSGTAAPGDFDQIVDTVLTIPAGSTPPTQVCSSVSVRGDTIPEDDEQFSVEAEAQDTNDIVTNSPLLVTIEDDGDTAAGGGGMGGDPHFSILLPSGQLVCFSIQGEHGFTFNLITDDLMQVNALFVPDAVRSEVTWIGALGIIVKGAKYKTLNDTKLRFVADERKIYLGDKAKLDAKGVRKIRLANGKLTLVENEKKNSLVEVDVSLEDIGLEFSVRFVKGNHLDMVWKKVRKQPYSHGLIGQFFRDGVKVDEARGLLLLPSMDPVPVMRKPVWHFMERETPDDQLCWVTMNPGYQGKRLIEGHYLDYLVDDVFSSDYSFKK